MKRFMTLAAAVAVACSSLAGAAHADRPVAGDDPRVEAADIKAVVVLIGANDYGLADIGPSAPPR